MLSQLCLATACRMEKSSSFFQGGSSTIFALVGGAGNALGRLKLKFTARDPGVLIGATLHRQGTCFPLILAGLLLECITGNSSPFRIKVLVNPLSRVSPLDSNF